MYVCKGAMVPSLPRYLDTMRIVILGLKETVTLKPSAQLIASLVQHQDKESESKSDTHLPHNN